MNYKVLTSIDVHPIEWNSFLPKSLYEPKGQLIANGQKQYLFCKIPTAEDMQKLKRTGLVEKIIPLQNHQNTYILLFDISKLTPLLDVTKQYEKSGTSMVGGLLFENFFEELSLYTTKMLPFILLALLLLIPFELWLDITIEMALYLLLLSFVLSLGFFEINSASLLATVFLVIYALTLINYIYSEGMDKKRLFFGIQISVAATIISALFLVASNFGLIHSFGVMLLVGLVVLHFYMNLRIYLLKYFAPRYHQHRFTSLFRKKTLQLQKLTLAIGAIAAIALLTFGFKSLTIDLNILNLLPVSSKPLLKMKTFEKDQIDTLPFVITLSSKNDSFTKEQSIKDLIRFQKTLQEKVKVNIIASPANNFDNFKKSAIHPDDPNLFAQFLLANTLFEHQFDLYSSDMSKSYIIVTIPIAIKTQDMRKLINEIKALRTNYPQYGISIEGKIADLEHYISLFIEEFFVGLITTLMATALFFWFYCKNIVSIVTIAFSALFSIGVLALAHMGFSKPFTVITLLSVILYAGLITDSLIQLFICYKNNGVACEKSVLEPIFISNISILIFLFGMLFVQGIMKEFAFDLSILLGANLSFVLFVVPAIQRHYLTNCSA